MHWFLNISSSTWCQQYLDKILEVAVCAFGNCSWSTISCCCFCLRETLRSFLTFSLGLFSGSPLCSCSLFFRGSFPGLHCVLTVYTGRVPFLVLSMLLQPVFQSYSEVVENMTMRGWSGTCNLLQFRFLYDNF